MNHQPFEDWLLADETLTPHQKKDLQTHLQACSDCAAIAEVNLALRAAKAVEPVAGFAGRFQVRLAARKKALRRRNFWGFFFLIMSVVGTLLWMSLPTLRVALKSPVDLLASWLSHLVSLWASLQAMGHVSSVLLQVVPGFVPGYVWTVIFFTSAGWSLLWVVSLIKFTKLPQGV